MALVLLATPLVAGLASSGLERRHVGSGASAASLVVRNPDLHTILTTRAQGAEIEARHHTEAQIAAKKAKAAGRSLEARHHTEAQIAAKKAKASARDLTQEEIEEDEDDALLTTLAPGGEIEARHHTEAQIAAKKAKASGRTVEARHHTEAQIAAKKAKASA